MIEDIIQADFVWTWVDGKDPAWKAKYEKYVPPSSKWISKRFLSCNELLYSLMLCHKYTPWHRGRYLIVVDEQTPNLSPLPREINERVHVVDHKEFIPQTYLPTFNSTVIEFFLPHIPGLSELFVSFNDDFFIWNDLPLSYFWDGT